MRSAFHLEKVFVLYPFNTEDRDIFTIKFNCILIIFWYAHRHDLPKTASLLLTVCLTVCKITLTLLINTTVSHLTGHLEGMKKKTKPRVN